MRYEEDRHRRRYRGRRYRHRGRDNPRRRRRYRRRRSRLPSRIHHRVRVSTKIHHTHTQSHTHTHTHHGRNTHRHRSRDSESDDSDEEDSEDSEDSDGKHQSREDEDQKQHREDDELSHSGNSTAAGAGSNHSDSLSSDEPRTSQSHTHSQSHSTHVTSEIHHEYHPNDEQYGDDHDDEHVYGDGEDQHTDGGCGDQDPHRDQQEQVDQPNLHHEGIFVTNSGCPVGGMCCVHDGKVVYMGAGTTEMQPSMPLCMELLPGAVQSHLKQGANTYSQQDQHVYPSESEQRPYGSSYGTRRYEDGYERKSEAEPQQQQQQQQQPQQDDQHENRHEVESQQQQQQQQQADQQENKVDKSKEMSASPDQQRQQQEVKSVKRKRKGKPRVGKTTKTNHAVEKIGVTELLRRLRLYRKQSRTAKRWKLAILRHFRDLLHRRNASAALKHKWVKQLRQERTMKRRIQHLERFARVELKTEEKEQAPSKAPVKRKKDSQAPPASVKRKQAGANSQTNQTVTSEAGIADPRRNSTRPAANVTQSAGQQPSSASLASARQKLERALDDEKKAVELHNDALAAKFSKLVQARQQEVIQEQHATTTTTQ